MNNRTIFAATIRSEYNEKTLNGQYSQKCWYRKLYFNSNDAHVTWFTYTLNVYNKFVH